MKKLIAFTSLLLLAVYLYAQPKIYDANAEARAVSSFHAIQVSNAFDVYLTQGDEEAVAISAAEDKYKQNIITEVKDGVLKVKYEHQGLNLRGNKKLKVYISFKHIDEISLSGACDLYQMSSIKEDDLKITLSGASDWNGNDDKGLGKLEVKNLKVNLSGASDLKISGNAQNLEMEVSGASDFKAFGFSADYCKAEASG
ncbi:MAG: hypothetical protein C4308_03760, partial [Chitinophagaceae bacterium]